MLKETLRPGSLVRIKKNMYVWTVPENEQSESLRLPVSKGEIVMAVTGVSQRKHENTEADMTIFQFFSLFNGKLVSQTCVAHQAKYLDTIYEIVADPND